MINSPGPRTRRPSLTKPNPGTLLDELHATYGTRLVRYLAARFGDTEDARDMAQEAWLRIHRIRDPEALANPGAFLFRTATNLGIDRARRRKLEMDYDATAELDNEPLTPGVDETVSQQEALHLIEEALEALPEKCGRAFRLHRLQGLSYPEIARELGVSQSMVEKYIIQALRAFRDRLSMAEAPPAGREAGPRP